MRSTGYRVLASRSTEWSATFVRRIRERSELHQVHRAHLRLVGGDVGIEGMVAVGATHVGADDHDVRGRFEIAETLLARALGFLEGHVETAQLVPIFVDLNE